MLRQKKKNPSLLQMFCPPPEAYRLTYRVHHSCDISPRISTFPLVARTSASPPETSNCRENDLRSPASSIENNPVSPAPPADPSRKSPSRPKENDAVARRTPYRNQTPRLTQSPHDNGSKQTTRRPTTALRCRQQPSICNLSVKIFLGKIMQLNPSRAQRNYARRPFCTRSPSSTSDEGCLLSPGRG